VESQVDPSDVTSIASGSSEIQATERQPFRWRGVNPFYVLLLIVGTLFVITCFAYAVMTVHQMDVTRVAASRQSSLIRVMEQHGLTFIVSELIVLAICTVAAIGTDEFWTKMGEAKASQADANVIDPSDSGDATAETAETRFKTE